MAQEVSIKIPKANDDEIVKITNGTLGDFKDHFDKQFSKIDKLLFAITTSVIVSVVGVLITAVGLFMDQMRYNNIAYKEYSSKIDIQSQSISTNNKMLDQIQQDQILIKSLSNRLSK